MKPYNEENIESIVQTAWKDESCPIINGIVFGTGLVKPLNVDFTHDTKGPRYELSVGENTDVGILKKSNLLEWTYITQLFERVDDKRGIRLSCGEGGMGADGFVAVSKIQDDHLIWIAFFDCSNPFIKVDIYENMVVGVTTLDNAWSFPFDTPEKVTVE